MVKELHDDSPILIRYDQRSQESAALAIPYHSQWQITQASKASFRKK